MHPPLRRADLPALATLLGGLFATAAGTWLTAQVAHQRDHDQFEKEATELALGIERDFQVLNSVLLDLRDRLPHPLTLTNLPGSADLIRHVPTELTNRITEVGVALLVSPADIVPWTEALGSRNQTNLQIQPQGEPAGLYFVPSSSAPDTYRVKRAFLPVAQVAELSAAEACDCSNFKLGADLFRSGNPPDTQAGAILSVIADGTAATIIRGAPSQPETNVSGGDIKRYRQTFKSIAPVYRGGSSKVPQQLKPRLADTAGLLFLTIDAGTVVELAAAIHKDRFTVDARTGTLVWGRPSDMAPLIEHRTNGVLSYQSANRDVVLGPYRVFLTIRSLPRWDWSERRYYPWATGLGGCLFSVVAASMIGRQVRRGLDSEVEAMELRTANAAMAAARETRGFITRELHDNTLQNLYVLSLALTQSRARLREAPDEAANALDLGLEEVRRISSDLRRFLVSDAQNTPALGADQVFSAIVERVRRGTQTKVSLDLDPSAILRLGARCSAELSQILREALSNALRHGHPREISVVLKATGDEGWTLVVTDDGRGFDPGVPSHGNGRQNMQLRCDFMEATLEVSSAPGQGTRIVVTSGNSASPPTGPNPGNS